MIAPIGGNVSLGRLHFYCRALQVVLDVPGHRYMCRLNVVESRQVRLGQVRLFLKHAVSYSVPVRHISEGAAPCPYNLAPCPIIQRPAQIIYKIKMCSDSRCKNVCNCLQICAHVCINRLAHKIVPRPRFIIVLDCDRILVVRALDCAQFILHPALFST